MHIPCEWKLCTVSDFNVDALFTADWTEVDVQKWLIKKGFKEESELFKGKRFGNYSRGIIQFYDWLS